MFYFLTEGKRPQKEMEMSMAAVQAWQRHQGTCQVFVYVAGFHTVPQCKHLEPHTDYMKTVS